jgi:bifunctional non-homologous end joining protein LigD
MLASAGKEAPRPRRDWTVEMKWDGFRAIAAVTDGHLSLRSRTGNDLLQRFPELSRVVPALGGRDAVLDGEIVALDRDGRPDFGLLQARSAPARRGERRGDPEDAPVEYYVFDLLHLDGESLLDQPLVERRRRLESLLPAAGDTVQVPAVWTGGIAAALESSKARGLEGILLKRSDSAYRPGARSPDWVKLKHGATQEVVIGGWRSGNGARAGSIGALLMGIPRDGKLDFIGRVGTGFTDRELDRLMSTLRSIERKTSPFTAVPTVDADGAHWVRPTLVGEVSFAEWTASGRLRQPAWRGLRPDKSPGDVVRE